MRSDREQPRGEARRVAERVRDLLAAHEDRLAPPAGAAVEAPADVEVLDAIHHDAGPARGWTPGGSSHDPLWPAARTRSRWPDDDDDDDADDNYDRSLSRPPAGWQPSLWQRLAARVTVRTDPGRRGALAVGVAVLLAAVLTGAWLVSQRPHAAPVSAVASVPGAAPLVGSDGPLSPAPATASSGAGASGAGPARVVVDVAGKVHRPGLYRLAPGSRIADALTVAGGPREGVRLDSLNLAAKVVDGQQIVVGLPGTSAGQGGGATVPGAAGSSPTVAVVSLNSATLEQLETLPGVGPVLGQKILDYRSAHGSFTSIDQLNDVSGIGDITFNELQPLVTL